MILLLQNIWNRLTNGLVNQIILLLILVVALFGLLLKFPVSVKYSTCKVTDVSQVNQTTEYRLKSVIEDGKGKINICRFDIYQESLDNTSHEPPN